MITEKYEFMINSAVILNCNIFHKWSMYFCINDQYISILNKTTMTSEWEIKVTPIEHRTRLHVWTQVFNLIQIKSISYHKYSWMIKMLTFRDIGGFISGPILDYIDYLCPRLSRQFKVYEISSTNISVDWIYCYFMMKYGSF